MKTTYLTVAYFLSINIFHIFMWKKNVATVNFSRDATLKLYFEDNRTVAKSELKESSFLKLFKFV